MTDDRFDFRDAESLEILHHQHPRRRQFAIHLRNDDEILVAEQFGEFFNVLGLMLEIHFFRNDA